VESRSGLDRLSCMVEELDNEKVLLRGNRAVASELLAAEKRLFQGVIAGSSDWKEYGLFCDVNSLVFHGSDEISRLKQDHGYVLFLRYYANTYFGVRQVLQLDSIREFADGLPEDQKLHLIAATVSVMTYAVSSTTHLAQFLKPTSLKRVRDIINKRRFNIVQEVAKRLRTFSSNHSDWAHGTAMCKDFREALLSPRVDRNCLVYADPPYFKEHYSRYYHVLDTFCLYDYPELTENTRTGDTTAGRYRSDRFASDFGLRASAEQAFRYLITKCRKRGATLALSYSDASIITIPRLQNLIKDIGVTCEIRTTPLLHSGQGRPRNRRVIEHLFILR
jgi:adenine-specific DNA-methyltransferase